VTIPLPEFEVLPNIVDKKNIWCYHACARRPVDYGLTLRSQPVLG